MSSYCTLQHNSRGQWWPWCAETDLVADAQRHLGNLDVDEGIVHRSSLLHFINVINWMLSGEITHSFFIYRLFSCLCQVLLNIEAKRHVLPTSGGFLNDLLTPAVRFSPWVTLLLGPIAPIVSSDNGRGLTVTPVTQTTLASARSPQGDPADYTLYSHWGSDIHTHTHTHVCFKVTSKERERVFYSSEGWHDTRVIQHIWQTKWKLLLIDLLG